MTSVSSLALKDRVGAELRDEIEQFLYREARLLDQERWDEWLALMSADIHYWMPMPENRRRVDKLDAYTEGRGALYDDDLRDLTRRIARFKQPSAWAEDPPTRHVHVISGVEAYQSEKLNEYVVHSTFVNYRSRGEKDNDLLVGRRRDLLVFDGDAFKVKRRMILITQSVFMAKNLNTFL